MASLLYFVNPQFSWEYASIVSVAMRCYSTSRIMQNLLSCIVPSACSGKTVEQRLVKAAKFIKENKRNDNHGSQTIRVYDNAPTRKTYIWKPTEAVNFIIYIFFPLI